MIWCITCDSENKNRARPPTTVLTLPSMAGRVILTIAYGIDVAPRGDTNVDIAEKAVGAIIAGSLRGRIFDLFPFRKLRTNYGFKISVIVHLQL
jgi:hypothetical protein